MLSPMALLIQSWTWGGNLILSPDIFVPDFAIIANTRAIFNQNKYMYPTIYK